MALVFHGDAGGVDLDQVSIGREQIKKISKHYSNRDIFNMDETGLFYKLQPGRSLADKPIQGSKQSKDR